VFRVIDDVLSEHHVQTELIEGIGLGVPGIVDASGKVVVTPNIRLSGVSLVQDIEKHFGVKAAAGNDVNVGLLGEKWMGAAQAARDVVGLFPGTGVGGAAIAGGSLLAGSRGAAAEFGHIIVEMDGPRCTCGNRGCLEAIAGRWAMERDIKAAMKKGEKTVIARLAGKKFGVIRSKVLKKAIEAKDKVVTRVMKKAAVALGLACVTLRHVFDPEMIVLGGGVIEACGSFILPIIRKTVESDPFFSKISKCRIVESRLGDDAVALGAVALVKQVLDRDAAAVVYPVLSASGFGEVSSGEKTFKKDFYVRSDGRIKKRNKKEAKERYGTSHKIGPDELKKVCKKNPELLVVASGFQGEMKITMEGRVFLRSQGIRVKKMPTPQAVEFYNKAHTRKAILVHVTC
jgi:glucokinase